jgi:hypothetical protein
VPGAGAGGGQQTLKLERCDDVGVTAIAVLGFLPGIEGAEPGSEDHRAHLQGFHGWGLLVVDGPGLAGLDTLEALGAAAAVETALRLGLGLFFT